MIAASGESAGCITDTSYSAEDVTAADFGLWGGSLKQQWRRIGGVDAGCENRQKEIRLGERVVVGVQVTF